jgi:UDP-GlcNAc:undecaprenyl-phosphate GlcNAc-1-phosphate transferase
MKLLLPFAVALIAALASIPLIRAIAARIGFVDQPAARKLHAAPMPLGGGIGLIFGLVLGTLAARPTALEPRFLLAWTAGLILVALVGLVDDRAPLNPLAKLLGQLVAALVLVLGSGHPDPAALGGFAGPVAVVGVVALMNACNFLDNMDGILGGIAVLSAAGFALVARASSPDGVAPAAAALAGAAAGFVSWPTTSPRPASSWATSARWRSATRSAPCCSRSPRRRRRRCPRSGSCSSSAIRSSISPSSPSPGSATAGVRGGPERITRPTA